MAAEQSFQDSLTVDPEPADRAVIYLERRGLPPDDSDPVDSAEAHAIGDPAGSRTI